MNHNSAWRTTTQALLPERHSPPSVGQYDIYPGFSIGSGRISAGYAALAQHLVEHSRVVMDGYGGVFWENLHKRLDPLLLDLGIQASWVDVHSALRPETQIDALVSPFLGGDDPLFGTRFTGQLADFFDLAALRNLCPDPASDLTILYGCGAALAGWDDAFLVYIDVPKNEIQFRARAGSIANLGCSQPTPAKAMYKRFYFVDWVALNQQKADLLPEIDLIVDEQRPDQPALMTGAALRNGLSQMSQSFFRVRPWFEPGAWGGQWMREHIPQLPQDVPNYAWSFELIVPENGLLFESDGNLLEVSFDFLMVQAHEAVLGECAPRFGQEFPIRFDFLDTFEGGNLSVQCHPRPEFIKRQFGENFTQDETYYILDCKQDAQVYLGFQQDIAPAEFRAALERSAKTGAEVHIKRFVNVEPAHKHDLFLIPNGTIHCSGEDNLVLEISATPYIFTFKMYDWLRMDLDGKPRPLNIARAFENLYFDRKGARIRSEFVAQPKVLDGGEGWQLVHLPTHAEHFYDVHRLEFADTVDVQTEGLCHVMSLVEGQSIILKTASGRQQRFNYAETFVVPAAADHYTLINEGKGVAKVVKAFVKPQQQGTESVIMAAAGCVIALDVGGTSVKSGVVFPHQQDKVSVMRTVIDSSADASAILDSFVRIVNAHLVELEGKAVLGIALAFPGPFDYDAGIAQIQGLEKYSSLYGLNIRHALQERLTHEKLPILFRNDAESAIVGECLYGAGQGYRRVIGITLGTGFGSAFIVDGIRQASGGGVPQGGWLYEMPFRGIRADDWFSIRGIIARLDAVGEELSDVLTAANQARQGNDSIRRVFQEFGADLGNFLEPFAREFEADAVLVLGGIAGAFDLFEAALRDKLTIPAVFGRRGADAPLLGVAELFFNQRA